MKPCNVDVIEIPNCLSYTDLALCSFLLSVPVCSSLLTAKNTVEDTVEDTVRFSWISSNQLNRFLPRPTNRIPKPNRDSFP